MELKISREVLLDCLSKFQTIVERKTSMPVLMNVLVKTHKNKIEISSTNLEVSLITFTDAEVIKEGVGTVNCRNLFDIVKELNVKEIHLKKEKNNWISLKAKNSSYKISGTKEDEFPVFPKTQTKNKLKIHSKVFYEVLQKTSYAVSLDETRYHLSGVFFSLGDQQDKVISVATDGHRMSIYDNGDEKQLEGMIIPKKGILEIKKLLENFDGDVELASDNNQLIVLVNDSKLMIRLIDGKYPNYKTLVPKNLDKTLLVDVKDFHQCLKRISVLVNKKSKGVCLQMESDKMTMKTLNSEIGSAEETIKTDYDGEKVEIGFNVKYILDVLNNTKSSKIKLSFKDSFSPVSFTSDDEPHYTSIVMPMRI